MKRLLVLALLTFSPPVLAGPPYVTDDPEPTDPGHYEIYWYTNGASPRGTWNGAAGIDFNYGAAPNLQLTAVIPLEWDRPESGARQAGLGNIELAAKYEFLHQDEDGIDLAFFPAVELPAASKIGPRHAALFLPLWFQRGWDKWTTFGGGGCTFNRGGNSRDFCLVGIALTRQITEHLQLGAEIYHQTADTRKSRASTGVGIGATYDLDDTFHLMASAGPGLQNAAQTGRFTWYAALLTTF